MKTTMKARIGMSGALAAVIVAAACWAPTAQAQTAEEFQQLKAMMQEAGFDRCDYRNLSGGIVAIHSGYAT